MSETLVRMPKLADTLVEGTLGRWLKQVGERVTSGEALASIETDKVTTDLTSPAAGTLLELMVAEGQTVPVETPIARIGDAAAVATPAEVEAPKKATPVAARLLADHGLTADQVRPRTGRLTKSDVLTYIEVHSTKDDVAPLTSMRRAIAEHMTRARQTIPHGQCVSDADLTDVVAWRDQHKVAFEKAEGASMTFTVLFTHALARAFTSSTGESADIGIAVALDAGLIVPTLRGADQLSLGATALAIAELAARARGNKLELAETQGARMTLTNVGSFGNLTAAPIIPLGQLGILGPGLVERRPMPGPNGAIRPGWRCRLSLVFDRRTFDDFSADRFLGAITEELLRVPVR